MAGKQEEHQQIIFLRSIFSPTAVPDGLMKEQTNETFHTTTISQDENRH